MSVTLVVARADNGVIGRDGAMPWHISEDLKRFKRVTMGTVMIMGRRTFESLPGLLSGRRHIVLTRDPDWRADGAEIARSGEEALALARDAPVSVIGGADIFAMFEPRADRIELTEIHASPEGDTVMPPFDPAHWQALEREAHPALDGQPAFSFVTLGRKA